MPTESKTTENQIDNSSNACLTFDQAHTLLRKDTISRGGLYNAIARGEVPHLRLGKRIIIPRNAFMRWLECAQGSHRRAVEAR